MEREGPLCCGRRPSRAATPTAADSPLSGGASSAAPLWRTLPVRVALVRASIPTRAATRPESQLPIRLANRIRAARPRQIRGPAHGSPESRWPGCPHLEWNAERERERFLSSLARSVVGRGQSQVRYDMEDVRSESRVRVLFRDPRPAEIRIRKELESNATPRQIAGASLT